MIKKHPFKTLLSILAVVLLALIAWFQYQSQQIETGTTAYMELINEHVQEEMALADTEWTSLREKIRKGDNLRFSTYTIQAFYPYYIYRNGRLDYWSDFRTMPDLNELKGEAASDVIVLRGSYYLVLRRTMEAQMQPLEVFQLIPLLKTHKIHNKYIEDVLNERIFPLEDVTFELDEEAAYDGAVTDASGRFLAGLKLGNSYHQKAQQYLMPTFIVASLLVATVLVLLFLLVQASVRASYHYRGLLQLIAGLLLLRWGMMWLDYPFGQVGWPLFDPAYYASSQLNASMGDMLLNSIVILSLIWYFTAYHQHFLWLSKMTTLAFWLRLSLALGLMLLGFRALYLCYHYVELIYSHSSISLDITANIHFDLIRVVAYLLFVVYGASYFLFIHVLYRNLLRLLHFKRFWVTVIWAAGTLLSLTWIAWEEPEVLLMVIIHALYVAVLYAFRLPRHLSKITFNTFGYLIVGAVVVAVSGADAVKMLERKKNLHERKDFATRVLLNEDPQAEFLLAEAAKQIRTDVFIQNRILSPFGSKDVISQKIKRVYLGNYFDKFDVDVYLFNSQGESIESDLRVAPYITWRQKITTTRSNTGYAEQYFIKDVNANLLQRYVQFIEVPRLDHTIGYIVVDLKLKRIIPNSVYPELLVDQRFLNPYSFQKYGYAVYSDQQLQFDAGPVNYRLEFDTASLHLPKLYAEGMRQGDWHHVAIEGEQGERIVMSSPRYPSLGIITNFSLLFLLLILFILVLIIIHATTVTVQGIRSNYVTRVQIFLNLAFFIPLFVVSIATLSLLSSTHRDNVINNYYQIAENIRRNISGTLDDYISGQVNREVLANDMSSIANYATEDLSLYSTSGKLIASSQPEIFNQQLLSKYINPRALMAIREQGLDRVIFSEWVGNLKYRSAYVSIRSEETGRLIGILNLPFFESNDDLDREMTDVTTTILNVFTFIFLLSLVLSYFFSRTLTFPLELITQRIRKTTLSEYNEPLEWNSDDEIGLMVGEYNKMLENLEESKRALARSEKESAWREMARQVAHEIKNPLTPMKLTLQHMQRILGDPEKFNPEKADKQVITLLNQVDTLSDIATSFSSFAQMPIPENVRFDVAAELRRTVDLYNLQQEESLNAQVPDGEVWILGDRQLFGRIFTNLILNAKQAIPTGTIPEVIVALEITAQGRVRISVKDNGDGIPEDIQDKVFIPNFSTKSTGSGIGLAVARRGVEHAGGKIWFETGEEGTTFLIEVPLADDEEF